MNASLQKNLFKLCRFSDDQEWKLLYRGSRDGFDPRFFHSKCDKIENTLTIFKSEHGNIFGGFANKAWRSNLEFVSDPIAFIFSLTNKDNSPFKAKRSNAGENALRCGPNYGPSFGVHDIIITYDLTNNKLIGCFKISSFNHPNYEVGVKEAQYILAGGFHSEISEIEVFAK